jgi:hypothetical protein
MQHHIILRRKPDVLVLKDDNKRIDKIIQNSYLNPFLVECSCRLTEWDFINPSDYLKKKIEEKIDSLIEQEKLVK